MEDRIVSIGEWFHEEKTEILRATSSLRGNSILVILSDEGGLPIFTRGIHINEWNGGIEDLDLEISSSNENILLMSGLIEAIMQLKEIVKPVIFKVTGSKEDKKPLYLDYARTKQGISLISLSTSPDFQQLPTSLLKQISPLNEDVRELLFGNLEVNFEKSVVAPLSEDVAIYWRVLDRIKRDLADVVSFILVYNNEGKFLFSTSKKPEVDIADPLLMAISHYIKRQYVGSKFKSETLIGSKQLSSSVIWHFKCFDKIFVFFTYKIPEMHTFDTLKSELLTFISNNLEKFISSIQLFPKKPEDAENNLETSRIILLS
ncbi:MAG: hypothetical protein ACFFE8_05790 [Candidatus Heimdallarchaeota archaeon]